MTPEEILRDLRDIHMPEQTGEAAGTGFVIWPLALTLTFLLIAMLLAWRRRSAWRRDVTRHLDAIERDVEEGRVFQGWEALAVLLRRIAMRLCERRDIAGLIGDPWLAKLDRLFETDIFVQGPGRGIATIPYSSASERDHDELQRIGDQLKATIDNVRRHLPKLGSAP